MINDQFLLIPSVKNGSLKYEEINPACIRELALPLQGLTRDEIAGLFIHVNCFICMETENKRSWQLCLREFNEKLQRIHEKKTEMERLDDSLDHSFSS